MQKVKKHPWKILGGSTILVVILLLTFAKPGIVIIPRNPIAPDGLTAIYTNRSPDQPFLTVPRMCEITPEGITIMSSTFPEYNEIHSRVIFKTMTDFGFFRDRYWDCVFPVGLE